MNHGTLSAYKAHGCRCEDCRAANARYAAKRKARQRQIDRLDVFDPAELPENEFGPWREQAACIGRTDIDWFPKAPSRHDRTGMPGGRNPYDPSYRAKVNAAVAICATCPVIDECLDAAIATSEGRDHGIRGGMTQSERRTLRKRRRAS